MSVPVAYQAHHAPPIVEKRVVANDEPAVLAVVSECALLGFERDAPREGLPAQLLPPVDVLRLSDPSVKPRCPHVVQGEPRVLEQRSVRVDGGTVRVEHRDQERDDIGDAPELLLVLSQLVERLPRALLARVPPRSSAATGWRGPP